MDDFDAEVSHITVATDEHRERRPNTRLRAVPLALAFGLTAFLLAALLLGACGARREPNAAYARFQPALKTDFHSYLEELGPVPTYAVSVELSSALDVLTGTATIEIPNSSPDPWSRLVFRLYPMLKQYGGELTVQSALVAGRPANFTYGRNLTGLQIELKDPLLPGESIPVRLAWRLEIPRWTDSSSAYVLFGTSQGITSLPLFYPSLAVYVPGPTVGTGGWWLEEGDVRGDAAYNVSSLFAVTTTVPANAVPVASGTLISSTLVDRTRARHVWVTGPSREFLLHLSPHFTSAYTEAYGTRVTSYWLPGQEAAGRAALRHAMGALRIYSDRFEPYPFRDLRVAPAAINYRGMEYPQVSLLGVELYGRYRENLEILVAHETAHQWWYGLVHNDPVNLPWLDESLAEYSVKLYMEALHGPRSAQAFRERRWEIPLTSLQENRLDEAVNQPVRSFENGNQYETLVYGKGALFYDAVRSRLGDRRFLRFLRDYLDEHRFGLVTLDDWLMAVEALQDQELYDLYLTWIKPPPRAAAMPTPAQERAGESDSSP